nr:MAG TPA: ASCH domain protein [Caudoviricetes sp.]
MRVLPILFNTEMVRAILDGRKTCTRRICKDANEYTVPDMDFYNADRRTYAVHNFSDQEHTEQLSIAERTCPICPGDILYVRETWCALPVNEAGHMRGHSIYYYRADGDLRPEGWRGKWRPSTQMPKEAARIWLKVTDVRVERLQEIASEQISREGVEVEYPHVLNGEEKRYAFSTLWNSTIKKTDLDRYGLDANPFVWVIEFEQCEKPEVNFSLSEVKV